MDAAFQRNLFLRGFNKYNTHDLMSFISLWGPTGIMYTQIFIIKRKYENKRII